MPLVPECLPPSLVGLLGHLKVLIKGVDKLAVERERVFDGDRYIMERGIVADVAAGIIRNVSVGYSVEEYHVVERDGAPDTYTAVRWTPLELSLVPIPADPSAQVRAAPQTFPAVITRAEQAPTHEAIAMTDETVVTTAAAPAEQQTADHSAIRAEGARAERERQAGIRRCAQIGRAHV